MSMLVIILVMSHAHDTVDSLVSISMREHPGDSCPYCLTSCVVNRIEADFRLIHGCAAAAKVCVKRQHPPSMSCCMCIYRTLDTSDLGCTFSRVH